MSITRKKIVRSIRNDTLTRIEILLDAYFKHLSDLSEDFDPNNEQLDRGRRLSQTRRRHEVYGGKMPLLSSQSWESFLRAILPYVRALHISWMWRVNGGSWLFPFADQVYDLTFDFCQRVASVRDPAEPKSRGSFIRRLFFNKSTVIAPPLLVRLSCFVFTVTVFCICFVIRTCSTKSSPTVRFLTPTLSCSTLTHQGRDEARVDKDWENPEIVGRCKR